ncbi:MAG: hypothetical protein ACP5GJ_03860 [Nanopusillaceae archaeon]|jgi:hypothetical protein
MDKSIALLLFAVGMGALLYLSYRGSALFYTGNGVVINSVNTPNINVGPAVTGGSRGVTAVIYYYDYQSTQASYLQSLLQQIGYTVNTVDASTSVGSALLNRSAAFNYGYTTLPLVQIGHYYFEVSMTYLPYNQCPGTIENVNVDGIYIPFCVYNGLYLLTIPTAQELYQACIETGSPSCYD